MTRTALPTMDARPQYFSLVTTATSVLGQLSKIETTDTIAADQVGRVGSSLKKTLRKSKEASYSLDMYVDNDLVEVAAALGAAAAPTTGGTVKLDPSVSPVTWRILHYDSEAASATLLSTTYLYNMVPLEFKLSLDADGQQVVSISGNLEDLYSVLA